MSSSINPNNINSSFPIAGQDNDSQGFRDNFTSIKTNLVTARNEISDLQNKVILKQALTGGTIVNNDMRQGLMSNVHLRGESQISIDLGTVGDPGLTLTNIDINYYEGAVYTIILNGPVDFNIINMPATTYSSVRLLIAVTNTDHYIRFSNTVNNAGFDRVEGYDHVGQTISFSAVNDFPNTAYFLFEISSQDGGVTKNINDVFRGRSFTDFDFTVNGHLTVDNSLNGDGGLTVTGDTELQGALSTAMGRVNTGYFLANVVSGQNLFANVDYHRFVANASPSPLSTIANLFITLPAAPEDGREIIISTLVPITSCFVSNMTPGVNSVYWLANTWAASGNVSVTLLYNTTVGRWMKV